MDQSIEGIGIERDSKKSENFVLARGLAADTGYFSKAIGDTRNSKTPLGMAPSNERAEKI